MALYLEKMQYDMDKILEEHDVEEGGKVQQWIDSEVLRCCDPYVPRDEGALIQSGTINTTIGSGLVKYSTPYARRWYYMPATFQGAPMRGNYWFERWKDGGGLEHIAEGIKQLLD